MQKDRSIPFTAIPFFGIHLACLLAFLPYIRETTTAKTFVLAIACFLIRKFGITGGYHRYFSHRTFKTSRAFQYVLAVLGALSLQRGALWWAAHHRHHHRYSDQHGDIHSPGLLGFLRAARSGAPTDYAQDLGVSAYVTSTVGMGGGWFTGGSGWWGNGGSNGLADRTAFFRRAWSIWGDPDQPSGF